MPITGMSIDFATSVASSAGTFSITTAKAPASCSARASRRTSSASSFVRARTWYVPNLWIDWGVRPRWPITGMPTSTMRRMVGQIFSPPSSFTASTVVSLTMRPALRSASSEFTW